jgi:hypothetical protein
MLRLHDAAMPGAACGMVWAAAALVGLAVALLATASHAGGGGADGPRPQLLIVADETKPMEVLAGFLRQHAKYDVRIVDQKDLPADLATRPAVFMYIHGRMTAATEKALVAYATGGGRLVILHHGIASARVANPDWLRMTGIHISPASDPNCPWRVVPNTTFTLVNLNPRHYITSHGVQYDRLAEYRSSDSPARAGKWAALDLPNTEVFLNQQFTDGREKTVLFGFHCVDPQTGKTYMQDRAGWYKPAGEGWVLYLQPGHAASDFQNRDYCQIVWNCLTWRPDMTPARQEAGVRTPASQPASQAASQAGSKMALVGRGPHP